MPRSNRRRAILTVVLACLLALGAFRAGRFLVEVNQWESPVVLSQRLADLVKRELPANADEAQVLAFLRANGFKDEHIRVIFYGRNFDQSNARRINSIEGERPRHKLPPRDLGRIVVKFTFSNDGRVSHYDAYPEHSEFQDGLSGGLLEVATPLPAR